MNVDTKKRVAALIVFLAVMFLYLQDVMSFQFLTYTYSRYYQMYVVLLFAGTILGTKKCRSINTSSDLISVFGVGLLTCAITYMYGLLKGGQSLTQYLLVPSIFCTFYTFKYFAHVIPTKVLMICIDIFVIALIVAYYIDYQNIYLVSMARNNAVYIILMALPIILLNDKKVISILLSLLIIIAVMSSAKRAGTIASIVGFSIYVISFLQKKEDKKVWLNLFYLLAIILAVFYLRNRFQDSLIFERLNEIKDDEGGGRMDIMKETFNMIIGSNIIQFFIGHGWNQVIVDSEFQLSAHNDFLEIFYDFGFITLAAYLYMIYKVFKMLGNKCISIDIKGSLMCFAIIFLMLSLMSHIFIYPHISILMFAYLGIITGLLNNNYENRSSNVLFSM